MQKNRIDLLLNESSPLCKIKLLISTHLLDKWKQDPLLQHFSWHIPQKTSIRVQQSIWKGAVHKAYSTNEVNLLKALKQPCPLENSPAAFKALCLGAHRNLFLLNRLAKWNSSLCTGIHGQPGTAFKCFAHLINPFLEVDSLGFCSHESPKLHAFISKVHLLHFHCSKQSQSRMESLEKYFSWYLCGIKGCWCFDNIVQHNFLQQNTLFIL